MRYRVAAFTLIGVIFCATAGLALTFSTGGANVLAHCKQPDHLVIRLADNAQPSVPVTATYVARMQCHNDPAYTSWGIVVSHRTKRPLEGLHLYPDTARWLSGELVAQAAAALPGQSVTILHTINKAYTPFATLTPADAAGLAVLINAAVYGR